MYKYIEVHNSVETWEIFKVAADADFSISLVVFYSNLILIGGLWTYQQSVEKYMKSYILKETGSNRRIHGLVRLLEEVKKISSDFGDKYDGFIEELNTIDASSRYQGHYSMSLFPFIDMFLDFCEDMRVLICGEDKFVMSGNRAAKKVIDEMIETRGRCIYNL